MLFAVLCSNCGSLDSERISPTTRDSYIGKEYALIQDCYLFKFLNSDALMIGRYYSQGAHGSKAFPEVVEAKNIGKPITNGIILAVIPSGTTLRVANIGQTLTVEDNQLWFVCDLISNGKILYHGVDTTFIQAIDYSIGGKPPMFNPETVQEIKMPLPAGP